MIQPSGFEQTSNSSHHVCKLQKAIYGLKQASRSWFEKLKSFLLTCLDFQVSVDDSCFLLSRMLIYLFFFLFTLMALSYQVHFLLWLTR